jgi:hypothetical protein
MTQSVSCHHQTYLGWAKGLSWKKDEAGSTKVLLATTSMCTYNVKIKECQITQIELFILGFLEACDLPKVTCRTLQTSLGDFVDIR